MSIVRPRPRQFGAIEFEKAAQAYLRSLPLEHFMESTGQSTQRKVTLESLDLVHARRPEVQIFSELLVQYSRGPRRKLGQVCPDNMIVVCDQPVNARGSHDVPLQPVGPFVVIEYVSENNKRKDYEDNRRLYEQELRIPYYLLFDPDEQDLILFRHTGRRFTVVKANEHGRLAIPELDLEVAIVDEWVRFWYEGKLLPLPADLQRDLDEARRQLASATRRAEQETRRADHEKQRADESQALVDQEREARRAVERELERLRASRQP